MVIPKDLNREIGHFNVFRIEQVMREKARNSSYMPYNRRAYYKISLIRGKNRAEYADKVISIEKNALLFATPKVPYNWVPDESGEQAGFFCIFTEEFFAKTKTGLVLDNLPLFQPNGVPVFELSDKAVEEISAVFGKIDTELQSGYEFKYDLIRNYVMELIHYGQKLQPLTASNPANNASTRVTSLFIELLERQFPIESPHQRLGLKTANEFAGRLAVHVNHLNKVLKETTGNTTTAIINNRVIQEAKILLRQTDWSVSDISFCLGYEELAHFSNFFKKNTTLTPLAFRSTR